MTRALPTPRLRGASILALVAATALAGCGGGGEDLVAGKEAFVQNCGACHQLERAGTTGVTGPDLDDAWAQARADGMPPSTYAGVVERQILYPRRNSQMPAGLVEGQEARNVAAYVARVAAAGGEDRGPLAEVGQERPGEGETATAEDGVLDIAADPGGALAFVAEAAEAEAGSLSIRSPNESPIPHNVALENGGIDEVGPVVETGGVSEITVDVDPGEYTFYCSVEGHREGGMEGTLTVR
jgi:mono/diheme cytochrome c family protein